MTMESIIHQTKPFDLLIKSSRHYNKRLYMRKEKFVKMHTIIRGLKVHIQNCTVLCRLLILQHNVFKAFNIPVYLYDISHRYKLLSFA